MRRDYPDILRKPTEEILARFRAGGSSLILTWWAFMASGGMLVAGAVLLSRVLARDAPTMSIVALVVGVLAGLVQVLGLLRWVYLVPALARTNDDPEASEATRAAAAVTLPRRPASRSGQPPAPPDTAAPSVRGQEGGG